MSVWTPRILSLLRIVAALLFMEHGLMKLFHFPVAQPGSPIRCPRSCSRRRFSKSVWDCC